MFQEPDIDEDEKTTRNINITTEGEIATFVLTEATGGLFESARERNKSEL